MAAPAPPASRWLFGPAPDLLLGCGLLYVGLFLAFALGNGAPWTARLHEAIPFLLPLCLLPHYGATLLRVYEQRADRRGYWIFSCYATVALLLAFLVGLASPRVGSLLLTIYLTWSPWHYTGQNYGLAVMFLRRRGVPLQAGTKRLLYGSFLLSYGIVLVVFHAARGSGGIVYGTAAYQSSDAIHFMSLGVPTSVTDVAFAAVGAGYLLCLGLAVFRLLRLARPRDLAPVAALGLTQALWFSIPFSVSYLGITTGIQPVDAYVQIQDFVFWVALGHGAQYVWVTTYYAKASGSWRGYAGYWLKTLAAGVAAWTVLPVLFGPDLLGGGYTAGVALLVASVVNIHHFILDGAIWKLRDGRIARVLLRARTAVESGGAAAGGAGWLRPAVWTLLFGWLLFQAAGVVQDQLARRAMERQDLAGMESSSRWLRWLGRSSSELHFRLGLAAGEAGDLERARSEFRRSLALEQSARGWVGLGFTEAASGRGEAARRALEQAVALEPENPEVWARSADVWVALGHLDRAVVALTRAADLAPGRADLRARLEQLETRRTASPLEPPPG